MKQVWTWFTIVIAMAALGGTAFATNVGDDMVFENTVEFQSTVQYGDTAYTFPSTDGTVGQSLVTDGAGTISWASGSTTAWDDMLSPDASKTHAFTTYTSLFTGTSVAADQWTFRGIGDFGNVTVVKIESSTGNPTDGTVLEVVSHDADADAFVVTANSTDIIQVLGSGAIGINSLEFDVSATTGAVTINDGGDAGNISIEGTVLDINSLDFVGAGAVTAAASSAITINPDSGNAAGEDLIVTAHNVQLTATGALTMSPDAAETTAVTITDTDYTNALSVGDNNILGTTGQINYTAFDVNVTGAGNVEVGGDLTVTGTASLGALAQDALVPASGAPYTITMDGAGTGGVTIGGTSTGTITMGGGAVLVDLPAGVDMTLSQGDFAVTDTANADMVTFTNNTMTTADLLTLAAGGTRTSNNLIAMTDAATQATSVALTANTQTSGNGFLYANSGAALTGSAFRANVTDGAGFTGYYFLGYDGAANDFAVKRYGEVEIAGSGSADMLTVTTGDVQIDDGKLEIDVNEDDTTYVKRNQGVTTGPVVEIEETDAAADNAALLIDQNATAAASYGLEIASAGGTAIHADLEAAAGNGILFNTPASYTGSLISVNETIIGANGVGVVDLKSTANMVAGAHMVRLDYDTGTLVGATDGFLLSVDDDSGAQATSYAVLIDSASNEALHVATGVALFDELATFTSGVQANGDLAADFNVNTEEASIESTVTDYAAGAGVLTIHGDHAGNTNDMALLRLVHQANADAQDTFILCEDNSTGAAGNGDDQFKVGTDGAISNATTMSVGTALTVGTQIINTPATEAFTTEADITSPLPSSTLLLSGDNDADNDILDLQDGTTAGQILILIAAANIDADDTVTINYGDTTATNAPATAFDKVGESATLIWTGTTWIVLSLNSAL